MYILMLMTTKIRKWGNSYAVRIPKSMVLKHGLKENGSIQLIDEANSIRIKPLRKKYNLDEMIAKITPKNRHPLIDWGPDVGREIVEWKE